MRLPVLIAYRGTRFTAGVERDGRARERRFVDDRQHVDLPLPRGVVRRGWHGRLHHGRPRFLAFAARLLLLRFEIGAAFAPYVVRHRDVPLLVIAPRLEDEQRRSRCQLLEAAAVIEELLVRGIGQQELAQLRASVRAADHRNFARLTQLADRQRARFVAGAQRQQVRLQRRFGGDRGPRAVLRELTGIDEHGGGRREAFAPEGASPRRPRPAARAGRDRAAILASPRRCA